MDAQRRAPGPTPATDLISSGVDRACKDIHVVDQRAGRVIAKKRVHLDHEGAIFLSQGGQEKKGRSRGKGGKAGRRGEMQGDTREANRVHTSEPGPKQHQQPHRMRQHIHRCEHEARTSFTGEVNRYPEEMA